MIIILLIFWLNDESMQIKHIYHLDIVKSMFLSKYRQKSQVCQKYVFV